jgi:hypothetical protein
MKYKKYLLIKLAEEAAEVAQAAIKCSLFGYESKDPRETNGESNLVKLQKELLDLAAVIAELDKTKELEVVDNLDINEYIKGKQKKLNYYYDIASKQTE